MATKLVKRLPKTTLRLLRQMLPDPKKTKEKWARISKDEGREREESGERVSWCGERAFVRKPFSTCLSVETVARWLGCSVANVRDIESAKVGRDGKKRRLRLEQCKILNLQTDINFDWLMDNDISKPPINSQGRPYTPNDFAQAQARLKSFSKPASLHDRVVQVNRLAEYFGMVAANWLQGLERGQADVYDYKLRKALRGAYDFHGERGAQEWQDLGLKAIFHGKIKLHRPDVGPLLDAVEARFKEIDNRKSGGKAPLEFPKPARPVTAARKPAIRKAGRKPARR